MYCILYCIQGSNTHSSQSDFLRLQYIGNANVFEWICKEQTKETSASSSLRNHTFTGCWPWNVSGSHEPVFRGIAVCVCFYPPNTLRKPEWHQTPQECHSSKEEKGEQKSERNPHGRRDAAQQDWLVCCNETEGVGLKEQAHSGKTWTTRGAFCWLVPVFFHFPRSSRSTLIKSGVGLETVETVGEQTGEQNPKKGGTWVKMCHI